MTTWDGRHSIEKIAVHVVYFVPNDRVPLADWRLRVDYLCRRIEEFHAREFGEQSTLTTIVRPEPFISKRSSQQLRNGNADAIFFKTLEETDAAISVVKEPDGAFPIVLALSDINWRPLDDFSRMAPRHATMGIALREAKMKECMFLERLLVALERPISPMQERAGD